MGKRRKEKGTWVGDIERETERGGDLRGRPARVDCHMGSQAQDLVGI